MDFRIATALNLSPDLVRFSRQSYAEELSSTAHQASGRPHRYGGYFPERPLESCSTSGNHSPQRDCTDGSREDSPDDDYSHALFSYEQMVTNNNNYDEPDCTHEDEEGYTHAAISYEQVTNDTNADEPEDVESTSEPVYQQQTSPIPSLPPVGSLISPLHTTLSESCPRPSADLEIHYTPSPTDHEAMMVADPPSRSGSPSSQVPIELADGHRESGPRRRTMPTVADWQKLALEEAFSRRDGRMPDREGLRRLAQQTHLPVTLVLGWFVIRRRRLRLRAKMGFFFSSQTASRGSGAGTRTLHIVNTGCQRKDCRL